MNCQSMDNLLDNLTNIDLPHALQAGVGDHLSSCEPCQHAWRSAQALQGWAETPAPGPRTGLFEDVIGHATMGATSQSGYRPFWLGTAVGGALAASLVAAILGLNSTLQDDATDPVPAFTIALHQTRDLSVGIHSAGALPGAQIRVVLTGGIELEGFAGQSELSWTTNLTAGINRLRLPVTAVSGDGGQVLVEVEHHNRRQVFLVWVDVDGGDEELEVMSAGKGVKPLMAFSHLGRRPYLVKFVEPTTHFDV